MVPSLFLVQTMFDVFLAVDNPMFVVYVAASVVVERREELLILKEGGTVSHVRQRLKEVSGGTTQIDFPFSADEDDEDANYIEFTVIFGLLNRFPKNITPQWLERVVKRALDMWKRYDYRNIILEEDTPFDIKDTFPFDYLTECEPNVDYSVLDYWRDEEEERAKKNREKKQLAMQRSLIVGGGIVVAAVAFYLSAQSWFFQSASPFK